jgi:hypothetical protein
VRAHEQAVGNLPIRQAARGEVGDAALGRRQSSLLARGILSSPTRPINFALSSVRRS